MVSDPLFPVEVFPEHIRGILYTTEDVMGYPIEYTSGAMLVALASAMGNNWRLQVRQDWEERPLLYMALVGNAGANKTHPMSFALRPLVSLDVERIVAAEQVEPYVAPPRLVASDVTQEGLVKIHQKNPRGLVLFVDELKAWVSNFSRYSGGSQEQFWLSNFSRSPIIVDRKSDPRPLTIPDPLISVLGSTQPSVLSSFATGDKSTNGFVDRMLFIIKQKSAKVAWKNIEVDPSFGEDWFSLVRIIANDERIFQCEFSDEARLCASAWQAQNVEEINNCLNDRLVGAYSKLEIYFVRFCLILHALHCRSLLGVDSIIIASEIVKKAALLAEYFRKQILIAQDYLYPDIEAQLSDRDSLFYQALPPLFSRPQAVDIARSLGFSRSSAYRSLKRFEGVYIEVNEDGEFYKLDS